MDRAYLIEITENSSSAALGTEIGLKWTISK